MAVLDLLQKDDRSFGRKKGRGVDSSLHECDVKFLSRSSATQRDDVDNINFENDVIKVH